MTEELVSFRLWCPPGVVADEQLLRRIYAAFVSTDEVIEYRPSVVHGVEWLSEQRWLEDRVRWMLKATELGDFNKRSGVIVGANGLDRTFLRCRFSLWPTIDSVIFGRVHISRVSRLLEAMVEVVDALGCPLGTVGSGEAMAFRDRSHALARLGASGDGRLVPLRVADGLSSVAWRTVVGRSLTDFFGASLVASLPKSVAEEVRPGISILRCSETLDDWGSGERRCDHETMLIEHLGEDCFYDPASGRLPVRKLVPEPPAFPRILLDQQGDLVIANADGTTVSARGHRLLRIAESRR